MRVSVTLFVPSLIPTGHTVTFFLSDLFCFFLCLGGIYAGLGDLICTITGPDQSYRYFFCVTSVGFESFQVSPYMWLRAPPWPLSYYLMYLCDSCMFFLYILRAFPYFQSIWSPISSVFSDVFASPMWAELTDVKAPSLRCLAEKLPEIVLGSRADSTTLTYLNGFKRWRAWANRFPEVAVLPATPVYVSLYLLSVLQASSSPAPVQNAFYSIRWAHDIAGFDSPTNHTLPQKVVESAKRRLLHLTSKKLPITPEILLTFFQSLDGSLVDTRFIAMALLAFAGFLRFDELANLKLKDLALHDTHFDLFIESSKTDQYREGAIVPIVKSGTDLCPWGNLEKYLSQAKLTLPTSSQGGDDYLFGNIQTKSGSQSIRPGSKLSYTRCREVLLKKIADVGLDPKSFSWHSFRSGGASAAANGGISDRMFKRHGRWRSENAKDGYVADSLESRLAVSMSLGL